MKNALVAAILSLAVPAFAQVTPIYVVTQRALPYSPLVGGVVVNPASEAARTVPLGFDFEYEGRIFRHAAVGENGAISLQAGCEWGCAWDELCNGELVCERSSFPGPWSGFPSGEPPNPLIAAFWDDLGLDGTPPASEIAVATLGTAPNREWVAEFRNLRKPWTQGVRSRASFQIRLIESTNEIKIHYGSIAPGVDQTEWNGHIGIESVDGATVLAGQPCSQNGSRCSFSQLLGLTNQVLTFGIPSGPELSAESQPLHGAMPGESFEIRTVLRNQGRGATTASVAVDFYLAVSEPFQPGRDEYLGRLEFEPIAGLSEVELRSMQTVPAGLVPGYYSLVTVVDANRRVSEPNETNNISHAKAQVPVGDDVGGYLIEAPPVPAGSSVPVHFELYSTSRELDVDWGLYISYDATFDPSDLLLAQGTERLVPGSNALVESWVTMPELTPSYIRYLLVVDPSDALLELDETNNFGFTDIFPNVVEVGARFVEVPISSGAGEPLEIAVSLSNSGPETDVDWRVLLSNDPYLDDQDVEFGRGTLHFAPREERSLTLMATVPEGTARQRPFFILVHLDPDGLLDEVDEFDNVASSVGSVILLGPDLVVGNVAGDATAFRGTTYHVLGELENRGSETAREFQYRYYLSRNRLVTDSDILLFRSDPIELAPGQSFDVSMDVDVPIIEPGEYFLALVVDALNTVDEDRETNNVGLLSPPILVADPSADFVGTEARVQRIAAVGEPLVVERILSNVGNAAGSLTYALQLRPVGPSLAGLELGRGTIDLEPGGSAIGSDRFEIPSGTASGEYWVEYILDPDGQISELDETNNVLAVEGSVWVESESLRVMDERLPVGIVGLTYDFSFSVVGASGMIQQTLEGEVPGLEFAAGRLFGQPSREGEYEVTLHVNDGTRTREKSFHVQIIEAPRNLEIITRSIPAARIAEDYRFPILALGGVPPYTFESRGLPAEFTLSSTGALSGSTAVGGTARAFQVEVTDDLGAKASRTLILRTLENDEGVRFRNQDLPVGIAGESYLAELAAEGGTEPYTFGVDPAQLPIGIRFESDELLGEPESAGVYLFSASVSDAQGSSEESLFVLEVESPEPGVKILTTALPAGQVGSEYLDENARPVIVRAVPSGAGNSVRISVSNGALPNGVTLAENGALSGVPTEEGVFAFLVAVIDDAGSSAVRAYGIRVDPKPEESKPADESGCSCNESRRSSNLWVLGLLSLLLWRRAPRKVLASVILLALVPSAASAGMPEYSVFEESRPYVPRVGGTSVFFPNVDDGEVTVQLPFTFHFFQDKYDSVSIGTNGLISLLPGTAASGGNEALLTADSPNAVIAAFWDDMMNASVNIVEEGTAPNRTFIIQWEGMEVFPGSPGQSFDMQLWLFEGQAGRFELHYGRSSFLGPRKMSASAGFEDASGLRGAFTMSCSPNCVPDDFSAHIGTVTVATMDAGLEVIPTQPELLSSERVYAGSNVEIAFGFRSLHSEPIGPFEFQVDLVDASGGLVGPIHVGGPVTLGPWETVGLTASVRIPIDTPAGTYELTVLADSQDAVVEPNENNNRAIAPTQLIVLEAAPNVSAAEFRIVGGNVEPGGQLNVHVDIANDGGLPVDVDYSIVLSSNETTSVRDRSLATGSGHLEPSDRHTEDLSIGLPTDLEPGRYRLALLVDPNDAVAESNELDNELSPAAFRVGEAQLASDRLPPAFVGVAYEARVRVVAVSPEAHYSISEGDLPSGLRLESDGRVVGTPTRAGLGSVFIRIVDGEDELTVGPLALEVFDGTNRLVILTREFLAGVAGQPYPITELPGDHPRLEAIGGRGTVVFSATSPVPEGLTLDGDGYLHGVPAYAGNYAVDIEATDGSSTVTRQVVLRVVPSGRLTLVSTLLAEAVIGEPYGQQLLALGGPAGTLTFRGAGLPSGLSLSATGRIEGTPVQLGTFRVHVEVERGEGAARQVDFGDLVVEVLASRQFVITPEVVPSAKIGTSYEVIFEAKLGVPPYAWRIDGGLPPGLSSETIGLGSLEKLRVFGAATERNAETGGIHPFFVEVTDGLGQVTRSPYAIWVEPVVLEAPETSEDDSGCSCREAGKRSEPLAMAWSLLVGLVLARRPWNRRLRSTHANAR